MIIDFCFKNYKSFKEAQNFSMRRDTSVELEKASIVGGVIPNEGLNRVSAVYGANASGKSNFLESIVALKTFIESGELFDVNYINNDDISSFNIIFCYNDKKYSYKLEILKDKIHYEELFLYNSNRPSLVFKYSTNPRSLTFGTPISDNESTAIKYNSQNAPDSPILYLLKDSINKDVKNAFLFFKNGIVAQDVPGNSEQLTEVKLRRIIENNPDVQDFYNSIIPAADLGIKNVKLIDVESSIDSGMNDKQLDIITDAIIKIDAAGDNRLSEEDKKKLRKSIGEKIKRASFTHEIDDNLVSFAFQDESHGTITASNIFLDLKRILEQGAVYVVDEMDCSMHPTIVVQIINIFNSIETNPNNAQLIFSTHDISILDSSIYGENILDRDQVWFTEKNERGQSSLYSLMQIGGTRKEDNLYRKYISGRFGAIPKVSLYYEMLKYWENTKNGSEK